MEADPIVLCESIYGHAVSVPRESLVFRPSVYGVVVSDGRLLAVTSRGAGKLCFPGGGVELGEPIEEALRREVREETGIEVEVGPFLHFKEHFFTYDPLDQAYHSFMVYYRCRAVTTVLTTPDRVDDDDAEKPQWRVMARLTREEFLAPQRDVFDRLRRPG